MKAVILVGGKGTRMRPLTFRTPKPLLPLVNRVYLEFAFDMCARAGVDEIVLCTAYLAAPIEDHFPGNRYRDMRLRYIHEDVPLDTAGAVKNAAEHLDDTFLVFNADIVTGLDVRDLIAFHRQKKAEASIYLTAVADPRRFGLVPIDGDGRVLDFLEKPDRDDDILTDLINAGCYVLEPSVLDLVPAEKPWSFERQLFPLLLEYERPLYGYAATSYWLDIGTPAAYLDAHRDILTGAVGWDLPGSEIAPGVFAEGPVDIDPAAKLSGPMVLGAGVAVGSLAALEGPLAIGPGVTIGAGASVARSVVHARASIDSRCEIDGSIIATEAILGRGVIVADGALVGPGAEIEEGNELRQGARIWPDVVVAAGSIRF